VRIGHFYYHIRCWYEALEYDITELSRGSPNSIPRKRSAREERNAKIIKLREEGKGYAEIAAALGLTYWIVSSVVYYFRKDLLPGHRRSEPTPREAEIVKLREQGKTYEEIGQVFGVSRERIRQILKKRNPNLTGWEPLFQRKVREAQARGGYITYSKKPPQHRDIVIPNPCWVCGSTTNPKGKHKHVCDVCRYRVTECLTCGKTFQYNVYGQPNGAAFRRTVRRFCSQHCAQTATGDLRKKQQRLVPIPPAHPAGPSAHHHSEPLTREAVEAIEQFKTLAKEGALEGVTVKLTEPLT
jgi:DNA-binding CsgD family transcriptional regulator